MILNVILWIWGIELAAGLLMYCVVLGKSFGQWRMAKSGPAM
jgi:hypothetical protein